MTTVLFSPKRATTLELLATQATAPFKLPPHSGGTVRVFNKGTGVVFVDFGIPAAGVGPVATIPAGSTAGSMPIAAGRESGFTIKAEDTHIAVICPTGETATLYVTMGGGI